MARGLLFLKKLTSSLSFRLQAITIILSLVGVLFGVRAYLHIHEQFGEEKSLNSLHDLSWQIGIATLFNLVSAYLIYAVVTHPVRNLCEVMESLTRGQVDVEVPFTAQGSELGSMARTVAIFKQNAIDKALLEQQQSAQDARAEEEKKKIMDKLANDFESTVLGVVEIVSSSASDMQANAKNLSAIADKTSSQSASVAAATEQTTISVKTVTSAVEELSFSINAINQQVSESARINTDAVAEVRHADATISSLSEAAEQIGSVVKLIQNIAGQTNLLALNATIEAARAGEAGKGFAVVASEVKNLANQTASATQEIAKKISTVQNVSAESVTAIRGIGKTIERTSEIATSISAATQQQAAAAQEIMRNVQQASLGTSKISASTLDVTKDASESLAAANEVMEDSGKLFQQSERLQQVIKSFLSKIRQT